MKPKTPYRVYVLRRIWLIACVVAPFVVQAPVGLHMYDLGVTDGYQYYGIGIGLLVSALIFTTGLAIDRNVFELDDK